MLKCCCSVVLKTGALLSKMVAPVRHIKSPMDMQKWMKSKAYNDYTLFVLAMNKAAKGLNAK